MNYIIRIKSRLSGSSFGSNVLKMAGGAAIGQLFMVAVSPLLTRLYSPEDFGFFGVFSSLLMMVAVVSCFRYQIAIPLPVDDEDAHGLVYGSILSAFIFSALITVILAIWGEAIFELNIGLISSNYWILSLGVLAIGINQTLIYFSLRNQKYSDISLIKMRQGFFQALVQLLLGWLQIGYIGLILGYVIGRSAGSFLLIRVARQNDLKLKTFSFRTMFRVCYRYRKFPLISTWSGLLNSAAIYLPTPLIALFYDAKVAGLFTLAQWVVGIPTDLVSQAAAKAYFGKASELKRAGGEKLESFLKLVTIRLALYGGVSIFLLCLLAPWVFNFVFGSEWNKAGEFTQFLGIMFAIRFVVAPVSQTLNILERQGLQFYWDLVRVMFVAMAITIPGYFGMSANWAILSYVVVMSITYLILLLLSLNTVKESVVISGEFNSKKD